MDTHVSQSMISKKDFTNRLKIYCAEKLKGYKVPVKVQIDYEEQYSDRYKKNRSFNVA